MSKLKNNLDSISDDTKTIIKDYIKLLMIKQTEKLAMLLGIISSVFIISTLLLIVVLISSLALAGYLNKLLETEHLGFWIVAGFYFMIIALLIIKVLKSKTPLLTNLFVKLILFVLNIDVKQTKTLKGLGLEKEMVNEKLDSGKEKIKTDVQLLRYSFMEGLLKEFLGLFSKKKKTTKAESDPPASTIKDGENETDSPIREENGGR